MFKARICMLAATAMLSAGAQAEIIWSENFDSSGGSMAAVGLTTVATNVADLPTQNLWHITSNFPGSGNYALGFVKDETPGGIANGNYNVGDGTNGPLDYARGFAVTSGISLANPTGFDYNQEKVQFAVFMDTDLGYDDGNGNISDDTYDFFNFWVSLDGHNWFQPPAASSNSGLNPVTQITNVNSGSYATYTIDLVAIFLSQGTVLSGETIYLGFEFNSGDAWYNDYAGVRIDNIAVSAEKTAIPSGGGSGGGGSTPSPVPEPATLALLGLGLLGLGFFRRGRSAS